MLNTFRPLQRRLHLDYVACYALYAVVITLLAAIFFIWPDTILAFVAMVLGRTAVMRTLYMTFTIVLSLTLLIVGVVAEPYLRAGIPQRQVLARFLRVGIPLLVIAGAGLVLERVFVRFIP